MRVPNLTALLKQCDDWNKLYTVGTEVVRTDDKGRKQLTKTASPAEVDGREVIVWLEDSKYAYMLSRIQPRKCRVCGCTTFHACDTPAGPCSWVEDDLCSGCVPAGSLKEAQHL